MPYAAKRKPLRARESIVWSTVEYGIALERQQRDGELALHAPQDMPTLRLPKLSTQRTIYVEVQEFWRAAACGATSFYRYAKFQLLWVRGHH